MWSQRRSEDSRSTIAKMFEHNKVSRGKDRRNGKVIHDKHIGNLVQIDRKPWIVGVKSAMSVIIHQQKLMSCAYAGS